MASSFATAYGQAMVDCEEALQRADSSYVNGRFAETVTALTPCRERTDISDDQAIAAFRLLALAHIRLDQIEDARAAIRTLFSIDPAYEADPVNDPPAFTVLVEIVRRQIQPSDEELSEIPPRRSWFRAHVGWFVSAGTVLAGGILAAVLTRGSSDNPAPLPEPPTLPN